LLFSTVNFVGPGSSVGVATELRAELSGDRIPRGGEIFRTCPDRPWDLPSLLYNGYRVFPGGKERPGRDAEPSPPSSAVGHERVELYLYSPLWAVRPVQSLSACTRLHCIYIYVYICFFFFAVALRPNAGHGLLILDVSRSQQRRTTVVRTPLDE